MATGLNGYRVKGLPITFSFLLFLNLSAFMSPANTTVAVPC